jgi:hypothetical protein
MKHFRGVQRHGHRETPPTPRSPNCLRSKGPPRPGRVVCQKSNRPGPRPTSRDSCRRDRLINAVSANESDRAEPKQNSPTRNNGFPRGRSSRDRLFPIVLVQNFAHQFFQAHLPSVRTSPSRIARPASPTRTRGRLLPAENLPTSVQGGGDRDATRRKRAHHRRNRRHPTRPRGRQKVHDVQISHVQPTPGHGHPGSPGFHQQVHEQLPAVGPVQQLPAPKRRFDAAMG